MRIFTITLFIIFCLGIIARTFLIIIYDHPRTIEYSKAEDLFLLFFGIGMAIWAGLLIFKP